MKGQGGYESDGAARRLCRLPRRDAMVAGSIRVAEPRREGSRVSISAKDDKGKQDDHELCRSVDGTREEVAPLAEDVGLVDAEVDLHGCGGEAQKQKNQSATRRPPRCRGHSLKPKMMELVTIELMPVVKSCKYMRTRGVVIISPALRIKSTFLKSTQ